MAVPYTTMICDDERHIREGILSSCDWDALGIGNILMARNGQEALDILDEKHVDILLSDIVMPEVDGLELCELVSKKHPHIMLYILTGYNDFEYAKQAIRSNVRDYILKPVDSGELEIAMEQAVAELDRRNKRICQITQLEAELNTMLPETASKALRVFMEDAFKDWSSLPSATSGNKKPISSNPTIQKVLEYVESNIANEDLNLSAIAESHLFLNSHYLGKLFKKEMGVKFSIFLLDRRINRAIDFIREHPNAKIYEIAEVTGFGSNPSYFSTLFRKVTGSSPTEFRDK